MVWRVEYTIVMLKTHVDIKRIPLLGDHKINDVPLEGSTAEFPFTQSEIIYLTNFMSNSYIDNFQTPPYTSGLAKNTLKSSDCFYFYEYYLHNNQLLVKGRWGGWMVH